MRGINEGYKPSGKGHDEEKGWDLVFTAIIADLTDSNTVGDMKKELDMLYSEKKEEIEKVKIYLLERYGTVLW